MTLTPLPRPAAVKSAADITFELDADSLFHIAGPQNSHRHVSDISMLLEIYLLTE